jgi:dipeptidyl aminopeptidase/acylaminoacyl peptidase
MAKQLPKPRYFLLLCSLLVPSSLRGDEASKDVSGLRPAAIRTEGVPEIPAKLFKEVKRYQDIRSASFQDWSPDGGILVSSRMENLHQIYHVTKPGASPEKLTQGDEPAQGGRSLPDRSILFTRGKGGDENYQIYRIPHGETEPRLLTDGKSRNLLGSLSRDGNWMPFTSTLRNGRDADLYLLDLRSGKGAEVLFQVDNEAWSFEDWSGDGTRLLLSRYVSANESYAFLLDLATRKKTPLPLERSVPPGSPSPKVRRDPLRFGPGSRSVYVVSDASGELRELARLELGSEKPEPGKYEWLTGDLPWDVEELEISPDGKTLAFTVNAEGFSRLFLLDLDLVERGGETAAKSARREVDLGTAIIGGIKFSPDSQHLGFTLGRASSPDEAFSLELKTAKLTRWTFSERSGFSEKDFVEPELLRYPSFDGRKIPALLFTPGGESRAGKKVPVVVAIHGGPEGQTRPSFAAIRQYLVGDLGLAVIAPNVRGSTGYGKSYALLDNGVLREDSVRDIGALLDWIKTDERLDASRVAVIGGSYGGYMVLASLVHFGAKIRAGVDIVGLSNFITFLERTSPYRRELRRAEYGDERDPEMRKFFEKVSPANHIQDIRSALLVVHGENDPRVPISETEQIVAKARSSGQAVWTLYAANEGHGFTRRENSDYEQVVTVAFFQKFLLGDAEGPKERSQGSAAGEKDGGALHKSATELFRAGKFAESAAEFSRSIEAGGGPHDADSCWERGLAFYYAGRFDEARKQFEGYQKVGPLDIENGLWHFLSIAAASGIEPARKQLFSYPDRKRRPFPALLDLYAGKGSAEAVIAEAKEGLLEGPELHENLFYAHLYLGKYYDAVKEKDKARQHFKDALDHPVDHFMLWCAKAELSR